MLYFIKRTVRPRSTYNGDNMPGSPRITLSFQPLFYLAEDAFFAGRWLLPSIMTFMAQQVASNIGLRRTLWSIF